MEVCRSISEASLGNIRAQGMEEIEELKKNLKKELRAATSSSTTSTEAVKVKRNESTELEGETIEDKLAGIVKPFMDKMVIKDKALPYIGPPTGYVTDDEVQFKIKQECRRLLWIRMSSDLLDQDELTAFYIELEKYASVQQMNESNPEEEKFISYINYKQLQTGLDPRLRSLLTAKLFMRLIGDDPYGRVNITVIFNYVMKKIWLKQTRLGLINYDFTGKGFITEDGLEAYLAELIPTLVQLQNMDPTFEQFYICTAARKFFFFLDPLRQGKIKITDILSSGLIDDILDLREKEVLGNNWFSLENTLRIYGHYLSLDCDHNGMLSISEFMQFGSGTHRFSRTFVKHLFSECVTYEGEMDYRTYVDFNLAFENRKEPQSVHYFFRVLDINHKGYLDASDLYYFFRVIEPMLKRYTVDIVKFSDLKDEIFDMVKPEDPLKITAKDLINCGMSDTIIRILIDVNGILQHDNHDLNVIVPPTSISHVEPRSGLDEP